LLEQGKPPFLPIENFLAQLTAAEKGIGIASNIPREAVTPEPVPPTQNQNQNQIKNDSQGTIRVDLKRLDNLVNLVGELVIDRTRFARIEEAMRTRGASADLSYQMAESVLLFGRHMNEIQNIIMKVRMVAIGTVFYKFSRMVRDLSRQIGKEVELVIEGGETELDKTLVEEIGDPLVHLIRNSIDHGIESPEQREAAGKPRKGIVRLSASQQGNTIVISVKDDGKGLDVERIRAKAVKNGLLGADENPPVKEIFNLIFEPGFSTAEKVTNISGRGVGMDVVKKNIQKLKGIIDLDSTPGHGTTTVIKLPITLAIVPSLMVEASGETFAIPIVNVIESIRISPSEIQRMGTSQFVKLREQVVPIVNFADALGIQGIEKDFWYRDANRITTLRRRRERLVFVVIGVGHERIGLIVDRLIGQQEIVIKPLGRLLRDRSGLAGGCLLGDGRVALVLDVVEVFGNETINRGQHARRAS
jgi:two-component system chemotaxis sensor kinase CheA